MIGSAFDAVPDDCAADMKFGWPEISPELQRLALQMNENFVECRVRKLGFPEIDDVIDRHLLSRRATSVIQLPALPRKNDQMTSPSVPYIPSETLF